MEWEEDVLYTLAFKKNLHWKEFSIKFVWYLFDFTLFDNGFDPPNKNNAKICS